VIDDDGMMALFLLTGKLEACSCFLRLASLRETCKNRLNSRGVGLSCHCLSLLSNPLHCKDAGLWMVYFNKMEKQVQQCSIMKKTRHADDLDKIAAENRKRGPKLICHHLPFVMPMEDDDSDNDGKEGGNKDRAHTTSTLNGHHICQSALMELIGVQKVWWATCSRKHMTLGTPPVHKLKGKASKTVCKRGGGRADRFLHGNEGTW
jgi:hypothetical protein